MDLVITIRIARLSGHWVELSRLTEPEGSGRSLPWWMRLWDRPPLLSCTSPVSHPSSAADLSEMAGSWRRFRRGAPPKARPDCRERMHASARSVSMSGMCSLLPLSSSSACPTSLHSCTEYWRVSDSPVMVITYGCGY